MKAKQYSCLCAVTRKAGRILTRKYDGYLKPCGLKITQFSMLANINRNPGITVSALAGLLFMDQTTVTRNIRVLEKLGFVCIEPEPTDQRIKRIQVTGVGKSKIEEARPFWDKAQQEIEKILGEKSIENLLNSFGKLSK